MADKFTISNTELLYDPLFDKKPNLKMKGKKTRKNRKNLKKSVDEENAL